MNRTDPPPAPMASDADALRRFTEVVTAVRPQLFRYCARMTGSVFDGEDVVQDTLAKAFHALTEMTEMPPLSPWIFRIAHNTALDFLKRYERKNVDVVADPPDVADAIEDGVDGALVEAALTVFVGLPPAQRSALVLKDVLGFSLAETAGIMGTTVAAVKAALVRARANVEATSRVPHTEPTRTISADERANLRRYADLFNARDWDGLRALLGAQSQLDLVSRAARQPAIAANYYTRYATLAPDQDLRAEAGFVDGVAAIAVYRPASSPAPAYFVLLEWSDRRIDVIRDFYYVPHITDGARFTPMA
jgi:RNA polymerase sigma-70 factor, ECF subfamily